MKSQPEDDWFDRVMLFFSNHAGAIAEEWFKLIQWLLVLSTFAFLWEATDNSAYLIILVASFFVLWLYLMFGYNSRWHRLFYSKYYREDKNRDGDLRSLFVQISGVIAISVFAAAIMATAFLLGTEASKLLFSK
ncbi:hypothetical protein [Hylemonella gracilis]|nr:hypothetical protein [Hylemonella gracilis]